MARFRRKPVASADAAVPREEQLSLVTMFQEQILRVRERMGAESTKDDPRALATRMFLVVLALSGVGLVLQLSHASTTMAPEGFWHSTLMQLVLRLGSLGALLVGLQLGPQGLRRWLGPLFGLSVVLLALCYVPGVGVEVNGARRWIETGFGKFQPSELARVVGLLWLADRVSGIRPPVRMFGPEVRPLLGVGALVFGLILLETDTGGALLFLVCWSLLLVVALGQVRRVIGPFAALGLAGAASAFALSPYVRKRFGDWFDPSGNPQVQDAMHALASGDVFGVGVGQGLWRNARTPHLESDYIYAMVGEELGLFGMLLVAGLFATLLFLGLRYVLCIKDRYAALAGFGLLLSVVVQAMIHMQVAVQLAPPKGMTLPFLSHGGTALLVSSFAMGVVLGAARRDVADAPARESATDKNTGPDRSGSATTSTTTVAST
ncbi:MAG: FtsW/RodA/SpoVE family cell cycle protein [Planctomycetia bacterium]